MLIDKLNGLCYTISICHHIHLHQFHSLFSSVFPRKTKHYGLPELSCLCLGSANDRQLWDIIGQEIYTRASLPVKPELIEDTFFN